MAPAPVKPNVLERCCGGSITPCDCVRSAADADAAAGAVVVVVLGAADVVVVVGAGATVVGVAAPTPACDETSDVEDGRGSGARRRRRRGRRRVGRRRVRRVVGAARVRAGALGRVRVARGRHEQRHEGQRHGEDDPPIGAAASHARTPTFGGPEPLSHWRPTIRTRHAGRTGVITRKGDAAPGPGGCRGRGDRDRS